MKLVVGLGNPGEKYERTRHNTGQIVLSYIAEKLETPKVKLLIPDTFMNHSGRAVLAFVKSKKDLADLIVIYDDIDLPLGKIKISFDRSSGGHNGLESVIRSLGSQEFVRIRVGISPANAKGIAKKPKGEEKVLKFLLGEFKKEELSELKKISKKIALAIDTIYRESKEKAMSLYN